MGWLIALAVLVLLAVLPLGISALYDSEGPVLNLIIGPARLQVFPLKKKDPKKQKPKKEKKKSKTGKASASGGSGKKAEGTSKKGGPLTDFLPLVSVVLEFLVDFKRKLRVDRLELNLVLAGGDPCDLAVNYGKACAAMGNLWPRLEEFLVIRKRDVKIQCDFEGSANLIVARLDLTITFGRLLSAGTRFAYRGLREYIKILNKRKGGASV